MPAITITDVAVVGDAVVLTYPWRVPGESADRRANAIDPFHTHTIPLAAIPVRMALYGCTAREAIEMILFENAEGAVVRSSQRATLRSRHPVTGIAAVVALIQEPSAADVERARRELPQALVDRGRS